jgi:hypothetical protein
LGYGCAHPDREGQDDAMRDVAGGAERWTRRALWCLPVYGLLTLWATLTHQPDYRADFPAYAEYITTPQFLVSHILGSIAGIGFGLLGAVALTAALARSRSAGLALAGLVMSVFGICFVASLFGVAAFAQPAIGQAFLDGHEAAAVDINAGIYDEAPLLTIGLTGVSLYSIGSILLGVAIWRTGRLPRWAGVFYAPGVTLIAFVGPAIGVAQTPGSLLVLASGAWMALTASRPRDRRG